MPDLSIFPILRIDQLRLYDTVTLFRAEQVLSLSYGDEDNSNTESEHLRHYCTKLIEAIQNELALRRIGSLIKSSRIETETHSSWTPDLLLPVNIFQWTKVKDEDERKQSDLMSINTEAARHIVSSSSAVSVTPMQVKEVRRGLRFRAQAIIRKLKQKKVNESTSAIKAIAKYVRKPLSSRCTAVKHETTESSEKELSRKSQRKAGFTASASSFMSQTVNQYVNRDRNQENTLDSSHLFHVGETAANACLGSCEGEGIFHPSSFNDHNKFSNDTYSNSNVLANKEGENLSDHLSDANNSKQSDEYSSTMGVMESLTYIEDMEGKSIIDEPPETFMVHVKEIPPCDDENDFLVSATQNTIYESTKCCFLTTHREPSRDSDGQDNTDRSTEVLDSNEEEEEDARDEKALAMDISCTLSSTKQVCNCYQPPLPHQHIMSTGGIFLSLFPTFECIFNFCKKQEKDYSKRNPGNNRNIREVCEALSFRGSVDNLLPEWIAMNIKGTYSPKLIEDCTTQEPITRWYMVQSQREELNSLMSDVLEDVETVGHWRKIEQSNPPEWNLLWTWGVPKFKFHHLLISQKVNRFQGTKNLTRKDLLKKKLAQWSMSDVGSDLMPATFNLPSEYTLLVTAFQSLVKSSQIYEPNIWILKPAGMSRGRGIYLIDDIGDVCYSKPFVAQKYIAKPLLYHDYKFDLRLYVLVTSFHPLEAFIYKEGLARFSLVPFSCSHDSLGDPRIHLTNSSVQKNFLNEMSRSHPVRLAGKDGGGNKVRWSWLRNRLTNDNVDIGLVWNRIQESCIKVLSSVDSEIPFQPNSFEVFGFDILIDDELKTWVLEVNGSPSMSRESPLDAEIKEGLIKDTVALVDPSPIDRLALAEICKERLRQLSGRATDRGEYYCKSKLELDLHRIFPRGPPRQYGETPKVIGGFQRLFPKS